MQPGVTLRDLVNAIPLYAHQAGPADGRAKKGKKNIFSGRILEIEGLPDLKVEQAFELSDASRRALGRRLHGAPEQGTDHRVHQQQRHADEADDRRRLCRRAHARAPHRRAWRPGSTNPQLLKADADAEYAAVIEIDLADIHEPIAGLPERPGRRQDAVRSGRRQDRRGVHRLVHDQHRPLPRRRKLLEGKRDIPVKLWVAPPTKMDAQPAHRRKATTACSAPPARAWRCRAARCAWATRRRCARARRCSPPARATSPTGWARTPTSTSASAELAAICSKLGPHPDAGRVPRRHGRDQRRRAPRSTST